MDSSSIDRSALRRLTRRAALVGGVSGLGVLALAAAPSVFAADATPEVASNSDMEGLYVVTRTRVVVAGMSVEDLTVVVRAGLVPIIMEIPGFVEYFIVQNPETRQRTAISIFEDKAGADISTTKATAFLKANNLARYYESVEPVVTAGELILFASAES